jgi:RHS repeat-associated protein
MRTTGMQQRHSVRAMVSATCEEAMMSRHEVTSGAAGQPVGTRPVLFRPARAAALALVLALAVGRPAAAETAGVPAETTVNSFTGRLSSTVPITVPAFRGIEPKISLSHTTSTSPSVVGVGWNLSAGSVIERASPGRGIAKYDSSDIYLLDGMELIPCAQAATSPGCAAGGTHAPRIENYARISLSGNVWTVWGRDGVKLTYTAVLTPAFDTFRWALSSVVDTKGNTVTYSYWADGYDEVYLDSVTYGNFQVKLYRETRPDPYDRGIGFGRVIRTRYRLKTVDVTVSGSAIRAYALTYVTHAVSGQSVLRSIQQYGKDRTLDGNGGVTGGTTVPAMTLTADAGAAGFAAGAAWAAYSPVSGKVRIGDFNGDGRPDLLVAGADYSFLVYVNNGAGFNAGVSWHAAVPALPPLSGFFWPQVVGDLNGDGKDDLVVSYMQGGSTTYFHVMLSTGASFGDLTQWGYLPYNCSLAMPSAGPMDLNGDGKTDLICTYFGFGGQYGTYTIGYAFLSTGTSLTQAAGLGFGGANLPMAATIQYADFNGDGKTDLLVSYLGGPWQKVYLSTGTSWEESTWSWSSVSLCADLTVGDFTGDGLPDLLCKHTPSDPITVYVNSGSSFVSLGTWHSYPTQTVDGWAYGDVNGDGRADVLYRSGSTWYAMTSTGTSFTDPVVWGPYTAPWTDGTTPAGPWVMDFNGDGAADVVYGNTTNQLVAQLSNARPAYLTQIQNGLGGTATITYKSSAACANPSMPANMSFPVVYSITIDDGRGDAGSTIYDYQGARWDSAYREWLGFRRATTTLSSTGAYAETYFWQRSGTIAKPEAVYKRKAGGAILTFEKFAFTENSTAPYTSLMTQHWIYDCNGDGVADANHNYVSGCRRFYKGYDWDTYANLIREQMHGDLDTSGDEVTAVHDFYAFYDSARYIVAMPGRDCVYSGIVAPSNCLDPSYNGSLVSAVRYLYDGATSETTPPTEGKLTASGRWYDRTGGWVQHSYGYDTYGNQTSITDPRGQTSTKSYDPTHHLFVVSTSDSAGNTVGSSWDYQLGMVTTSTDMNGQPTTAAYDALGRLTLTTRPDGSQVKVEYLAWGTLNGTLGSQRTRQSVLMPGGTWMYDDTYFDGAGRTFAKVTSNSIRMDTFYDAAGHVTRSTVPYQCDASGAALETVRYDQYAYDDLGRRTSTTLPDGAVVQQAYGDGWSSATDALGKTRISYFDGWGRLTRVQEDVDGTPAYTWFYYDAAGRRTRAVDAVGIASVATYDSLGQTVQKADADKGVWTYLYDATGRLTGETDPLSRTTSLQFDSLGRVTRRVYPDATADTFAFDEAGRGASKGRLTTAVSASGVTTRAWYDVMGRRTRYEEVVDGTTYTISHAYDTAGRLASVTYPDGEVVTYGFATSGLAQGKLVTVSGSVAGTLVSNVTYTSRGQVATMTYGNGITTTFDFDAYGERPASIQVGSLLTINYGYDGNGRITSLTSPNVSLTNWAYSYDSLGRLTRAVKGDNAAYTYTYRYDAIGRITCNNDKGSYAYGDAAHPHAVTTAGSDTYAYDGLGNLTSGGGRTIAYNFSSKPVSITTGGSTTTFVYNADGLRVKKSGNAGTVVYVGSLHEVRGGAVTRYYVIGGMRVAKRDANGTSYLHVDHLGTTRLVTNSSGAAVQRYEYAPFGKLIGDSAGPSESHRFTGQESDDETGLIYFRARYYDPALGRFITPDPISAAPDQPQELDQYQYANNNPVSVADPSGHAPVVAILGAVLAHYTFHVITFWFMMCVIGTALTFTNSPFLQTIGMVIAGYFAPATQGLSMAWRVAGGVVALAQSPISPLDGTVKKVIGWVYTMAGFVRTIVQGPARSQIFTDSFKAGRGKLATALINYIEASGKSLVSDIVRLAVGIGLAYVNSALGPGLRYFNAIIIQAYVAASSATVGPLTAAGATYDLAYTLRYPDGRTYDLRAGEGKEVLIFYYHTGFESNSFALGRQHIAVYGTNDDGQVGYWELGPKTIGFTSSICWGQWITTQKSTVILDSAQAKAFRDALNSVGGGRYIGQVKDSYTYVSAALYYATGGAADAATLHINPGLIGARH